ncbi:hypothetical protein LCGC14_2708370 [marine sediment metagenome]|uniref:Uncharacterized protein n=1 Tax=marine sediment metagenome TaxID=412755 RepID=A0A0F8ZDT8_9ZZZZ
MPNYGFRCEVHEEFEITLTFTEVDERGGVPQSMPCPLLLYEGHPEDDPNDEDVRCNEDSPLVLHAPHKMMFDRKTRRKHNYPKEHGLDDDPRPSARDPDFKEKVDEKTRDAKNRRKGRKIFTGDLGKPAVPIVPASAFAPPGKGKSRG